MDDREVWRKLALLRWNGFLGGLLGGYNVLIIEEEDERVLGMLGASRVGVC